MNKRSDFCYPYFNLHKIWASYILLFLALSKERGKNVEIRIEQRRRNLTKQKAWFGKKERYEQ
ncbi:hypothetical protein B5G10_02630 [Barnesiella sp. An55]|nr:hypothetical protein B5G10_02630 [Barnesiella sp. An55]